MHFRTARETWTPTDIHHLDDVSNVLPFKRGPAAQAQARYGAIALERDRQTTRQAELRLLIDGYEGDVRQLNQRIAALREEYRFIEVTGLGLPT